MPALRRVLVTGGAGFLGTHLAGRLADAGAQVVCLDNFATSSPGNVALLRGTAGVEIVEHDICDPWEDPRADGPFDVVFHLASPASPPDYLRLPVETLRVGSHGTAVALDVAARSGARLVLASTSEVYGDPARHPQREDYWGNVNPIGPRSVYDEAKRYAEALVFAHHRTRGADVGVARLFNTYGPRMRADDGRMVPAFIGAALAGEPLAVTGSGAQTRSLCFVDDTVEGLIALAGSDVTGPVNIGNPDEVSVADIARLVVAMTGSRSTITHVDAAVDDPQRRCPDITAARETLGWEPKVPTDEGLAATIEWFRDHPPAQPEATVPPV